MRRNFNCFSLSFYYFDFKRTCSIHSQIRTNKRCTGIKLIQKRWRQTKQHSSSLGPPQKCKRTLNYINVACHSDELDDSGVYEHTSVHPTLIFRPTHIDYSSMRHYRQLHFLNSSTILAHDSHGLFDLIGIDDKASKDGDKVPGRLLASGIKLSSDQYLQMKECPLEVYGYQSGAKFVVGLSSGDVEIFSTQRAAMRNSDEVWHPSTAALFSCLPPVATKHIGPRRRFRRNIHYPLQYMLFAECHETMLQDSHKGSIFEDLHSCYDDSLSIRKTHRSFGFNINTQWAFREGSIGSSSVLIGACVDQEGDCFSLRIFDERSKQAVDRQKVFVDVSCRSRPRHNDQDNLSSICFTGEYGLVTSHNVFVNRKMFIEDTLKWHDLRMIWKQPVQSMSLSFPQNEVAAISSFEEMIIKQENSTYIQGGEVPPLHLVNCNEQKEQGSSCRVSKLTGSNDSSDRFVVTLLGPTGTLGSCHEHLIIDSSLRQVAQNICGVHVCGDDDFSPFCFSSCLDFMALSGNKLQEKIDSSRDVFSVYDISRHRSIINDADVRDNQYLLHRGRKRTSSSPHNTLHSSGYLGSFKPTFLDVYGLESTVTCMAMDDLGSAIVCGTSDGDIYIL